MMLIESGDDLIAIDCGLMFPDADEMPGIDYVIPDFSYALAKRDGFRAVFLTHGHEDHIGAVPYLLRSARVPIYGTPLTLALVAEKLREHDLLESADLRPMKPHDRIERMATLAVERGRRVALLGMSTERNVRVASELGYLRVPDDLVLSLDDLVAMLPAREVILSTGSQGEPHSALSLLAAGEHKAVQVERGDLVIISARVIPGNERTIGRVINALLRRGADVLYEDNAFVHVSGHASQEDLKLMLNLTRPRFFIPVHGEYRHLLGHARLAESVGLTADRVFLIEDGLAVEMTKTAARVIGRFPVGRVLVDGKGIGDIGSVVLRDRQLLAESGLVAVSLVMDRAGRVVSGPEIASRGFVYMQENQALIDEIKQTVMDAVTGRDPAMPGDRETVGALVRTTVRHFINQRFQRKPVVLPIILEV